MLDLIDRKTMLKNLENSGVLGAFAKYLIEKQPAVDAVEVVRCKDCIYRDFLDSDYGGYCCAINRIEIHLDDYCSKGERKVDKNAR